MRRNKALLLMLLSDPLLPFWGGLTLLCLASTKILSPDFLVRHGDFLAVWRRFANSYGLSLPAVRLALLLLGVSALIMTGYSLYRAQRGISGIAVKSLGKPAVGFLLILFIAGGFLVRIAISWEDIEALTCRVLIDDAFYSFQVARNLAAGNGFSHDGLSLTNGVQPLVVLIMAAIFKLVGMSQNLPVHAFLSVMSCLSIFSMLLIFRIVSRMTGPAGALFSVFLWAFTPYIIKTELNGLETGLAAFCFLLSFHYYVEKFRCGDAGKKQFFILGCLLGLGVLARLDFGFFALALSLDYLLFSRQRLSDRFKMYALTVVSAFMISSPWFAYNIYLGGSLMPVSGKAVRFLARVYGFHAFGSEYLDLINPPSFPDTLPLKYYALNFLHALKAIFMPQPVLKVFPFDLQGKLLSAAFLIALLLIARKTGRKHLKPLFLTTPLLYLLFLFAAYSLYIFGQWFYPRYFFPGIVIGVLIGGIIFSCFAVFADKYPALVRLPVTVVLTGYCMLFVFLAASSLKRQFFPGGKQPPARYYGMSVWTDENTGKDAVIGVFQAGMMAYFTPRKTICLDGVVNAGALDALKQKKIDRYVRREGISYLMDWDWVIEDLYAGRSSSADPYENLELVYNGFFQVYRVLQESSKDTENIHAGR